MHVRSACGSVGLTGGGCKSGCLSLQRVSRVLTGLSMFYCAETAGFPRGQASLAMQSQSNCSPPPTPSPLYSHQHPVAFNLHSPCCCEPVTQNWDCQLWCSSSFLDIKERCKESFRKPVQSSSQASS